MAPPRLWLSFLLGVLVVAGCPRRFDPRAAEIHSNNPEAEADYRSAHRKWQDGDLPGAASALKQFFENHSSDPAEPLLPLARLLEARVARGMGELDRARELLRPLALPPAPGETAVSPAIAELSRFELGLVEYRRGDFAEAQRLLAPFSGQIIEGDEATELHAVLADIYRRAEQSNDALREYELFYRSPHVRPLEQLYIRAQVTPLILRLPATEQRTARGRFGLENAPNTAPATAAGKRVLIGLLLPLSGKDRALGERVLHGALWAASSLSAGASAAAVDLRVRDSAAPPGGLASAVADLQREGAQAIVTSPVRAESAAIAAEAERRGLVALQLGSAGAAPGTTTETAPGRVFHLLRENEARAESLAQHLRASGLNSVAVLAPATPYGQSMTRAFVTALGGSPVQVVAQLSFPAAATTFTAQARQILDLRPQAVFVPATVTQLELIAGQLAAVGALSTYHVEKRETEPPVRMLLSSAEGMGERLLKNAGRYLQGAVLAPIAAGGATVIGTGGSGRFSGYAQEGGGEPGALDALGYDAVQLLYAAFSSACAEKGAGAPEMNGDAACSAGQLSSGLHALSIEGATGPIAFDAAGQRSRPAWLLRVEGQGLQPLPANGH